MENKDWLMEHLSEVARTCYTDLQAITSAGVKCFPPSYDIAVFFIKRYHRGLVEVVRLPVMAVGDVVEVFKANLIEALLIGASEIFTMTVYFQKMFLGPGELEAPHGSVI